MIHTLRKEFDEKLEKKLQYEMVYESNQKIRSQQIEIVQPKMDSKLDSKTPIVNKTVHQYKVQAVTEIKPFETIATEGDESKLIACYTFDLKNYLSRWEPSVHSERLQQLRCIELTFKFLLWREFCQKNDRTYQTLETRHFKNDVSSEFKSPFPVYCSDAKWQQTLLFVMASARKEILPFNETKKGQALDTIDHETFQITLRLGLFNQLRHSCDPNAMIEMPYFLSSPFTTSPDQPSVKTPIPLPQKVEDGDTTFRVIALRKIQPGETITISWIPNLHLMTQKQRMTFLFSKFNIRCDCARCLNPNEMETQSYLELSAIQSEHYHILLNLYEHVMNQRIGKLSDTRKKWKYNCQAYFQNLKNDQHFTVNLIKTFSLELESILKLETPFDVQWEELSNILKRQLYNRMPIHHRAYILPTLVKVFSNQQEKTVKLFVSMTNQMKVYEKKESDKKDSKENSKEISKEASNDSKETPKNLVVAMDQAQKKKIQTLLETVDPELLLFITHYLHSTLDSVLDLISNQQWNEKVQEDSTLFDDLERDDEDDE